MYTKIFISHKIARLIAEAVENEAVKNNWNVSIAIVNEAAQLVYFLKMDDSTTACGDIAIAKARHTVYYRRDTKYHEDLLMSGVTKILGMPNVLPVEGGLQLMYKGTLIGGIGVSGVAAVDDGRLAKTGADFLAQYVDK